MLMLQIRKTAGTPQQDADQRPALEPVHRLLRLPASLLMAGQILPQFLFVV